MKKNLYLFKTDIESFFMWKERVKNLQAIWYDGRSDIIKDLPSALSPSKIIIENTIAHRLLNLTGFTGETIEFTPLNKTKPIIKQTPSLAVLASNDTHVYLLKNIIFHLRDKIRTDSYTPTTKKENAKKAFATIGIKSSTAPSPSTIAKKYDALLIANDWSTEEKYISQQFQKRKKPVICLQESVLDFGGNPYRMEWCDYPLVQGLYTIRNLKRDLFFLTGNPRYEHLSPKNNNKRNMAIINSNFTYGISEAFQMQWIEDIDSVLKKLHINYKIAQHPRDTGNLRKYPVIATNASVIHDTLSTASLLITRFSSLIHECLALGTPVIYYNPHKEKMGYDFNPDQKHLFLTQSKDDLYKAIVKIRNQNTEQDNFYYDYGMSQHGSSDHQASKRVADAIKFILALPTHAFPISRQTQSSLRLALQYQKVRLFSIKR